MSLEWCDIIAMSWAIGDKKRHVGDNVFYRKQLAKFSSFLYDNFSFSGIYSNIVELIFYCYFSIYSPIIAIEEWGNFDELPIILDILELKIIFAK